MIQSENDIAKYLKENLKLNIKEEGRDYSYGGFYKKIHVQILLEDEVITEDYFSIDG